MYLMTTEIFAHFIWPSTYSYLRLFTKWFLNEIRTELGLRCSTLTEAWSCFQAQYINKKPKPHNWYLVWTHVVATFMCWKALFQRWKLQYMKSGGETGTIFPSEVECLSLQRGTRTSCMSASPTDAQVSTYLTYWWLWIPPKLAGSLQESWSPTQSYMLTVREQFFPPQICYSKTSRYKATDFWFHEVLVS